jgi:uncharacterized protein YprB with RNaseH-like and TPR domain
LIVRPSLVERLRGIVQPPPVAGPQAPVVSSGATAGQRLFRTADVLGGRVVERREGAVVVVDRRYSRDRSHGRKRIGEVVDALQEGRDALATLHRAWPCRNEQARIDRPLLFDIETTGLAGGAGTQAFLIGCAVIQDDELFIRQFLLPGFEHERALLAEFGEWALQQGTLVSFNGRTFDAPLIETRYLFHRLDCPLTAVAHIDLLHPSRRLWKERPSVAGPPLDDDSCKLAVLERHLGGVHRVGDVPGFEIPSRFFRYVRDGDALPLEAVMEHNRIDLVSLALVAAHAIRLIEQGPAATKSARECLGLGRLYERAALRDHAEACYARAAAVAARVGREPDVRAEALRRLALCRRRAGRLIEAAQAWNEIVSLPGCPSLLRREARQALAIHHEHRSRDLRTARRFVLDALAENPSERWREEAKYRLARIERKIGQTPPLFVD